MFAVNTAAARVWRVPTYVAVPCSRATLHVTAHSVVTGELKWGSCTWIYKLTALCCPALPCAALHRAALHCSLQAKSSHRWRVLDLLKPSVTPQQQTAAAAAATTRAAAAAMAAGAGAACIPAATQHALPGLFASLLQEQQRQQAAGQRQLVDGMLQWQKQQQPGLGYSPVLRLFETPVWDLAGIHEPWDSRGKQLRALTESAAKQYGVNCVRFVRWEFKRGMFLGGCKGSGFLVRGPCRRFGGQQHLAHSSPSPPGLPFDGLAVLSAAGLPPAPGAEKGGKTWYQVSAGSGYAMLVLLHAPPSTLRSPLTTLLLLACLFAACVSPTHPTTRPALSCVQCQ